MDLCRIPEQDVSLEHITHKSRSFYHRACDVSCVFPSEFLNLLSLEENLPNNDAAKKPRLDATGKLKFIMAVETDEDISHLTFKLVEDGKDNNTFLYRLHQIIGTTGFSADVNLKIPTFHTEVVIHGKDFDLVLHDDIPKVGSLCVNGTTEFSYADFEAWTIEPAILAKLSITVKMDEWTAKEIRTNFKNDLAYLNKRILQNGAFTDALIIARDGEVRCHKSFLIARSPFFERMFESEMKEGLTSTVTLDDMSEGSVRALLDYIYCSDITKASEQCEVAFELLLASSEYEIPALEEKLQDTFYYKCDNDWFSIPIAVELLQYAGKKLKNENNESFKRIQEKAADVLKSKPEKEIWECPEFQRLFKDKSAGGMDVALFLLTGK